MRAIFAQIIAQIIAEIFCELKMFKENRADNTRAFRPACSARSLTRSDWLTYIYLFKSVRLESAISAVTDAEMRVIWRKWQAPAKHRNVHASNCVQEVAHACRILKRTC